MSDISKKLQNLTPEQRELLLKKLQAKKKAEGASVAQKIGRRKNQKEYPLSYAQERLWFFDQLVPHSPVYNISACVKLDGALDVERLEKAINAVTERHDVLRLAISTVKGEPKPSVAKNLSLTLEIENAGSATLEQLAGEESAKPFELGKAPLLRCRLIRMNNSSHALLLTIHHIVADGWSMGVFIHEVSHVYRNLAENSSPLPDLEIQYFDYAAWQKEQAGNPKQKKQLDFWEDELRGMPTVLELPLDRPRPSIQSFGGRHHTFYIPKEVTDALRELARKQGATLFVTVLAAFQTLLYRYSGQDDFGVGIPIANRNRKELEKLIGFFVNTLVIRSQPSGELAFADFMAQVKERSFKAYDNQDVPFEQVVERVQPQRDNHISPLFQVMFEMHGDALGGLDFGDLDVENIDFETATAKFDLLMILEERASDIKGVLEYNDALFNASTIENLCRHFVLLLKQVAQNPQQRLDSLKLLDGKEQKKLIEDWNDTGRDYPASPFIHEYTRLHAKENPDHPALLDDSGSMSYKEFNARTSQLAHLLRKEGVGREDRVAVCMDRSLEMVIALHGILKAGAAYTPFDPEHPQERRDFMLQDSAAKHILTQAHLAAHFEGSNTPLTVLDKAFSALEKYDSSDIELKTEPDQLAYMIYTSGSTGKPKGTLLSHGSILNRLQWMQEAYPLTAQDVVLQKTPFSFDVSVWEFFWPFMYGATLAVAKAGGHKDSAYMADIIQKHGVTTMHFVPPMLNVFLEHRASADCKSLKRVFCSGEALPYALSVRFYETLPECELHNLYGPTEAAVDVTAYACPPKREDARLPIGRPIANTRTYILDKALNPVPAGVSGELFIAGIQLSRGYANRPGLTAEKFIADPFAQKPGSRMYSTGDLCRYLENGEIEYIGRIDQQVKVRGFRIELGEIETVLRQHDAIKECLVLARGDSSEKYIAAYCIADKELDREAVRAFAKKHMPDYMLPDFIISLEKFPLTANGKIDRRALPAVNVAKSKPKTRFVSPRNKLEAFLHGLWCDVLGVKKISVYDNFFDLGGNSLKAAVLINKLQEQVEVQLNVGMVFQAPRVAEFAMFAQEYFSDQVLDKFGENLSGSDEYGYKVTHVSKAERIKAKDITKFRTLIKPLARATKPTKEKNPPAIFVLSPPRSGSTLLRIMLAGHPQLFSPPELDLLSFNSMGERQRFFYERGLPLWLEAPAQALMQIKNISAQEAEKEVRELERKDISVKEFYNILQKSLDDRLLIDKTPSYALDPATLQRAEDDFDKPYYIHLQRHPYATIYSFIEAKLDKNFFKYVHSFSRQQLAELIWLVSHQNIENFLKDIPAERKIALRFEDMLKAPEREMRRVSDFLNLPFTEEMLKPYQGQRMTEGLKDSSQMVGDFKFYLHSGINNKVAERWRKFHREDFLGVASVNQARHFGYKTEDLSLKKDKQDADRIKPVARQTYMPLSFAQQRLWFIDQLEPGSTQYNVPGAVRLKGKLDVHLLEKSLNLLIDRHEILRTTFHTVDGEGRQKIHGRYDYTLKYFDYSKDRTAEDRAREKVSELSRKPFKLDELPLFHTAIIKLAEHEHILVLVAHHIITDGWSNRIFIRELTQNYDKMREKDSVKLPSLSVQYADVALWQHKWIESKAAQSELDFWKKELQDAAPLLELPTDRPRRAGMPAVGKRFYFELDEKLSSDLRLFCKSKGVTSFAALMGVFQLLMHHYAQQEDVLIGTPVAGRSQQQMEDLIGFFVNTIVVRYQFDKDETFSAFLERLSEKLAELLDNQNYPFEKILDALEIERSLEHSPLFQVMFSMQSDDTRNFSDSFKVKPYRTDSGSAKFDLLLEMYDSTAFRGAFEYNTALFDDGTIKRMQQHFVRLLQMAVRGTMYVKQVELTDGDERDLILRQWNESNRDYDLSAPVTEWIQKQAAKTPAARALVYEEKTWNYAEFDALLNRVAHMLLKNGLHPEDRVAVCMDRSPEMVVALNGIMRGGGVYVPLDPQHPAERRAFMLKDCGAKIVLTQPQYLEKFDSFDGVVLPMALEDEKLQHEPAEPPAFKPGRNQLAYMIYTSGSTGTPKGTLLEHRGLVNRLQWMQEAYPISGDDVVLQKTPFSFDVSVWEFFWPFMYGASLVIAQAEGHKDTSYLSRIIQKHGVTTMHFVPPMLKVFLEDDTAPACSSLKQVICSGEALPYALSQAFYKTLPGALLHNLYGPTEATIDVSHYTCPKNRADEKLPIGRPVANTTLYVLNPYLQPLPVGVAGELHIGGIQLARGYANRAALTAEKFIPDPFSGRPGARLYKTGDLCRLLENGEIEYIGRIDHQVKVRGFRIELGEIEAALRKHRGVENCVVLVRPFGGQENAIVAYVVAHTEKTEAATLRDFLKNQLPEYMVPAAWVFIESIPLTANGKIDRRALPKPDSAQRSQLQSTYVAPRNEKEEKLAGIWQNILKQKKVGVQDNFFELGGDSIVGIQLISAAAREGLSFSPRELFEYPTVEGLAAIAREGVAIHAEQEMISGEIIATPIMRWFAELPLANRAHWNQALMLKAHDNLNPRLLKQVAEALYKHHDILRLRWRDAGNLEIAAAEPEPTVFEWHDLRDKAREEQLNAVKSLVDSIQAGHDLAKGSLFKLAYFSLDPKHGDRLFISIHHLAVDVVSWRVLMEDIQLAYGQLLEKKEIQLPAKTTSFKYWAQKLNNFAHENDWQEELRYWQQKKALKPATLVAKDEKANIQADATRIALSLPEEETALLRGNVSEAYNSTVEEIIITALFMGWKHTYGHNSLLMEMESHGREALFEEVDLARTVGWFTTLYPVVLHVNASAANEIIKGVKEQLRSVPENGIGYGLVSKMSAAKGTLSDFPNAQILFNYLGRLEQDEAGRRRFEALPDEKGAEVGPENRRSHLLEITSQISDGKLTLYFNYCPNAVDSTQIEKFASATEQGLQQLIKNSKDAGASTFTPSDFKDADVDQDELDDILSELDDLE